MAGQSEHRKSFESKGTASYGVDFIDDTTAYTGNWWQMYVVSDATISSLTASGVTDGSGSAKDLSGKSFTAGTYIPLPYCTAVKLSSGTVIMFKSKV